MIREGVGHLLYVYTAFSLFTKLKSSTLEFSPILNNNIWMIYIQK